MPRRPCREIARRGRGQILGAYVRIPRARNQTPDGSLSRGGKWVAGCRDTDGDRSSKADRESQIFEGSLRDLSGCDVVIAGRTPQYGFN